MTGEQALEITETMVRSGAIDIVIVDSVAALVPRGRNTGRNGRFTSWDFRQDLCHRHSVKLTAFA